MAKVRAARAARAAWAVWAVSESQEDLLDAHFDAEGRLLAAEAARDVVDALHDLDGSEAAGKLVEAMGREELEEEDLEFARAWLRRRLGL